MTKSYLVIYKDPNDGTVRLMRQYGISIADAARPIERGGTEIISISQWID